jgi:hypothetical protein
VSPGDLEVVQFVVSWVVTVPVFALIVVRDEARLDGEALARAWPPSSRDAAIFGSWLFGVLYGAAGIFVHFAATRRSARGALLGLGAAATLLLLDFAAQFGTAEAVDWLQR